MKTEEGKAGIPRFTLSKSKQSRDYAESWLFISHNTRKSGEPSQPLWEGDALTFFRSSSNQLVNYPGRFVQTTKGCKHKRNTTLVNKQKYFT